MFCSNIPYALFMILTLLWLPSNAATKIDSSPTPPGANDTSWLDQTMDTADVRHFLGRTGFGLSLPQLDKLSGKTRAEAIDWLMGGFKRKPELPMPQWVNAAAPRYWVRNDMNSSGRRRFQSARDQEIAELRHWWVSNMLQTSSPQTERMVLFWHDHFATSYHGVNRQSTAMARQNQTFRQLSTGSYRDMLKAMIRDPALLFYLDNLNSKKGRPNENLARELLELFTLGEGNYTEKTVREAARSLTGYAVSQTHNLSFQLQKWKQDEGQKNLFGINGNHDGDALIDIVLEQPAAAEYLANKFWHAFVSDSAPDSRSIEAWAFEFTESNFSIATLYKSVISSEAFWAEINRSSLVKSPATLLLGTARTLEYPKQHWQHIYLSLARLGMDLFAPPNVSGWSEGASFVTPGRLLDRYQAVQTLLSSSGEFTGLPNNNKNIPKFTSMEANAPFAMSDAKLGESMQGESMQGEAMQGEAMHGEAMQGEAMRSNVMTSKTLESNDSKSVTPGLQIRMAAEDYQGPVEYRVELLDDQTVVWTSGKRYFKGGHNTEKYGRILDAGNRAWQLVGFDVPVDSMQVTRQVIVHFLNDGGDESGDRNLYIDRVRLGSRWIDSADGEQVSECAPENRVSSGDLFCSGSVRMEVPFLTSGSITPRADWSASEARVRWASFNPENSRLILDVSLEDVQTPENNYHTVSFRINGTPDRKLEIRMNSFDCWPDCFDPWPECAWVEEDYPDMKTLSFPLESSDDKTRRCHYDKLGKAEQQLVTVLWNSLPVIIEHLRLSIRGKERFADELAAWHTKLKLYASDLASSRYNNADQILLIDESFAHTTTMEAVIASPQAAYTSVDVLATALQERRLGLLDIMLSGIDSDSFPELSDIGDLPLEQQLVKLVSHPVFQVH
ncbi:MAG: DUF1800 family protein [Granulosicoccus sp.]